MKTVIERERRDDCTSKAKHMVSSYIHIFNIHLLYNIIIDNTDHSGWSTQHIQVSICRVLISLDFPHSKPAVWMTNTLGVSMFVYLFVFSNLMRQIWNKQIIPSVVDLLFSNSPSGWWRLCWLTSAIFVHRRLPFTSLHWKHIKEAPVKTMVFFFFFFKLSREIGGKTMPK